MRNICRICLGQSRNLRSVFQAAKTSIPYSEMIMYISSLKISLDDGYPDKICLICRNKLTDAYDFKCLIERSDKQLRNSHDSTLKKLCFNNFSDIKIEIDCFKVETDIKSENLTNELTNLMNTSEGSDITNYKNISIKRVNCKEENLDNNNEQALSVEEFLNTIKDEIDDNVYYDMNSDDDLYLPPTTYKKRKGIKKYDNNKKKQKQTTAPQKQPYVNSYGDKITPLKPVILKDVRVARTQPIAKTVVRKKYNKKGKESICPYCGKLTKSIKSHLLIHTGDRKYKCSECEKSYFTENQLHKHMVVHTGIKSFSCDKCVATFYNVESLRSHLATHLDVNPHVCDICSKGFKRKHSLMKHMQRHSSANKTVMCELCNMSFFEKFQLTHHMRVHTGERPYNCELCSQPYSYKHDFNRHCLKKHGVFLKRRSVYTMNAAVLTRERALMKQLAQGVAANPFQGPQAALAYEYALRALQNDQIRLLDP